MDDILVKWEPNPLVIGATGLEEIVQNVRIILGTLQGSVPLDRAFGVPAELVDLPVNQVQRHAPAIIAAVEKYEPRVKVTYIVFEGDEIQDGRIRPVVKIRVKAGVL